MKQDKLDIIRSILGLKPIYHTFTKEEFASATLLDGTKVETEEGQELVPGSILYVVAEDGTKQLAPTGLHETENAVIEIGSNGDILSIKEKAALAEVEVETEPKIETEDIVAIIEKIVEEKYGDVKKVKEAMEILLGEVQTLKEDLGKMKNKYSEFENTPAQEPATRNLFSVSKTEDAIERKMELIRKQKELFSK